MRDLEVLDGYNSIRVQIAVSCNDILIRTHRLFLVGCATKAKAINSHVYILNKASKSFAGAASSCEGGRSSVET